MLQRIFKTLYRPWLLALGWGLALLAQAAPPASPPHLVLWNSQQASDITQQLGQAFGKKNGVTVDVSWINASDLRAMLLRHANEGDLPDVALIPGDLLSLSQEIKLSPLPEDLNANNILTEATQSGRYEGVLYGLPVIWGNHLMLFYNRSLVSQPAKSFEEMELQLPALKAKGVKALGMNFGEMYWFAPFMGAFDAWPLNERNQLTLNTPGTAQALEYYFGLVKKGLTLKECRFDCAQERFINGEFAYAINGDWAYRDLVQKLGPKLGVAMLPQAGQRSLVPMSSAYVLVFPNHGLNGPKRELLLRFARYMQSAEVQKRWARDAALLPVSEPIFREVTRNADANFRAFLGQLRRARAMPNTRAMAFAWDGMAKGFSSYYNNRSDATQAAAMMQARAEKSLQRAASAP